MSGSENIGVDDIDVAKVWEILSSSPKSVLIDVRTRAEWAFVGHADLSSLGKSVVLIEWLSFPDMQIDSQFVDRLNAELESQDVPKNADLFFICRSGVRSLAAGKAMTSVGYTSCHNVAGGFEGPLDGEKHRGTVAGWKALGLPWVQG